MKNIISNTVRNVFVAMAMVFVLVLPNASVAQAADLSSGYYYDTFVPDSGYYYDTFTPDTGYSYDTFVPDSGYYYDTFTPDNGYYYDTFTSDSGYLYDTFVPDSGYYYDTYVPDNGYYYDTFVPDSHTSNYSPNSYNQQIDYIGGSSYGSGNYGGSIGYIGGGSWGYGPSNCTIFGCGGTGGNNGCTHNCGNDNPPPPTDVCPNISGLQTYVPDNYEIKKGKCVPVQQHYAYNPPQQYYPQPAQPYVTLSAVPYTGLSLSDMGPVGQAVFYSLFALITFAVLYTIKTVFAYRAIKRG